VCNGGASTAYQALAAGTPVIGLPLNLDQSLVMSAIERAGAGILVRSGTATATAIGQAVSRALRDPALRSAAAKVAGWMQELDARIEFRRAVSELPEICRAPAESPVAGVPTMVTRGLHAV
jgi:UDP:flavonoid glycosyltransferase YjiC (YdhE family)